MERCGCARRVAWKPGSLSFSLSLSLSGCASLSDWGVLDRNPVPFPVRDDTALRVDEAGAAPAWGAAAARARWCVCMASCSAVLLGTPFRPPAQRRVRWWCTIHSLSGVRAVLCDAQLPTTLASRSSTQSTTMAPAAPTAATRSRGTRMSVASRRRSSSRVRAARSHHSVARRVLDAVAFSRACAVCLGKFQQSAKTRGSKVGPLLVVDSCGPACTRTGRLQQQQNYCTALLYLPAHRQLHSCQICLATSQAASSQEQPRASVTRPTLPMSPCSGCLQRQHSPT